jgi:hypothetical protein
MGDAMNNALRLILALASAVVLGSAANARQDPAPSLLKLDARAIVSAQVDRGEQTAPSDLRRIRRGVFVDKDNAGGRPKRSAKTCVLGRGQIAAAVTALNHAQPAPTKREGLGADFVFRFRLKDRREVVAVIGDSLQTFRGGILAFIDTKLAVLAPGDLDSLYRIAAGAGCPA